jgi:hypothetical protein
MNERECIVETPTPVFLSALRMSPQFIYFFFDSEDAHACSFSEFIHWQHNAIMAAMVRLNARGPRR